MSILYRDYIVKPPTIRATQYFNGDFEEFLHAGLVDGKDREGTYIETLGSKIYVKHGDYIKTTVLEHSLDLNREVIPRAKFEAKYLAV